MDRLSKLVRQPPPDCLWPITQFACGEPSENNCGANAVYSTAKLKSIDDKVRE